MFEICIHCDRDKTGKRGHSYNHEQVYTHKLYKARRRENEEEEVLLLGAHWGAETCIHTEMSIRAK